MKDYSNTVQMQGDGWPVGVSEETKRALRDRVFDLLEKVPTVTLSLALDWCKSLSQEKWPRGVLLDYQYATVERALLDANAEPVWRLPPKPAPEPEPAPKRATTKAVREACCCPKCGGAKLRYLETILGWRDVLNIEKGKVHVEGCYQGGEGYDDEEAAKEPALECQAEECKHRWPMPQWLRDCVEFD